MDESTPLLGQSGALPDLVLRTSSSSNELIRAKRSSANFWLRKLFLLFGCGVMFFMTFRPIFDFVNERIINHCRDCVGADYGLLSLFTTISIILAFKLYCLYQDNFPWITCYTVGWLPVTGLLMVTVWYIPLWPLYPVMTKLNLDPLLAPYLACGFLMAYMVVLWTYCQDLWHIDQWKSVMQISDVV